MRFDRYTINAQKAVQAAGELARQMKHTELGSAHLLLALLTQEGSVVASLVAKLGGDSAALERETAALLQGKATLSGEGELYYSRQMQDIFTAADSEAKRLKDEFTSSEHLLIALAETRGHEVYDLLQKHRVTRDSVYTALASVRGASRITSQNPEEQYQALDKYAKDLTLLARQGKLDPVIGRDDEIRRVLQVLLRRQKNNPVLIGEPGTGKTAIAEGVASRIVSGDVPEGLKDKRLVSLDLGSMIAGAKYRGEFEDRLKAVLKEITSSDGEILLFIDELHTLVGAGAAEGSLDASNMLKPALARGELHCIGATTLKEYRKHVEKDAALERRFQPVYVGEPSVADTLTILRGIKEKYEIHHGVTITDDALVSAATLSDRYITDRFLPDKAIDLMDEAASRLRMEIDSVPTEIDALMRKKMALEIEKTALAKEKKGAGKERYQEVKLEIASLQEEIDSLMARWTKEKELVTGLRELKEQLEVARHQEEEAQRQGDYEKAAQLRYGEIPRLDKEIGEQGVALAELQSDVRMLEEEVGEEDIAKVVASWTGIQVSKLMEGEMEKLLTMEHRLAERVVHQDEAIEKVADAVRRARSGLQDPNRPLGSFLFMGPTGVGKTELVKALAELLFDDEGAMVRVDMSEYMERHSVSRLIGAPPGYVGHEEGGYLTEAVRRRPYSVVLLDEIEKAHNDVFNVLLQILDDGRLTDGLGRTVDFKNTIVIMTSNIGSHLLEDGDADEVIEEKMRVASKGHFRPEFLNRIDDIVVFNRLRQVDMLPIVDIQLARFAELLRGRELTLDVSARAKELLAERGYDLVYGARPLKRAIQTHLQNPLAKALLQGGYSRGDTIHVDRDGEALTFVRREA